MIRHMTIITDELRSQIEASFKKSGRSMSSVSKEIGMSPSFIAVCVRHQKKMDTIKYGEMKKIIGMRGFEEYVTVDKDRFRNALSLVGKLSHISLKIGKSQSYISTQLGAKLGTGKFTFEDIEKIYKVTGINGMEYLALEDNYTEEPKKEVVIESEINDVAESTHQDIEMNEIDIILKNQAAMYDQMGRLIEWMGVVRQNIKYCNDSLKKYFNKED